jgi:hypothetical protein
MMNNIRIFFQFLLSLAIIKNSLSENLCNLRIADNMMKLYKGSGIIYDNGVLSTDKYGESSSSPYISTQAKDIEYLYAFEIHNNTSTHGSLVKD